MTDKLNHKVKKLWISRDGMFTVCYSTGVSLFGSPWKKGKAHSFLQFSKERVASQGHIEVIPQARVKHTTTVKNRRHAGCLLDAPMFVLFPDLPLFIFVNCLTLKAVTSWWAARYQAAPFLVWGRGGGGDGGRLGAEEGYRAYFLYISLGFTCELLTSRWPSTAWVDFIPGFWSCAGI